MPKTPQTASVDEMSTVPLLRSRLRIAGGSRQPTVHSMQVGPVPDLRVAPGGAESRSRRAPVRPAHAMWLGLWGEALRDRDARAFHEVSEAALEFLSGSPASKAKSSGRNGGYSGGAELFDKIAHNAAIVSSLPRSFNGLYPIRGAKNLCFSHPLK